MTITLNGTTGIQTPLGSAGSPVDSNTTTPTTGIYYPSATTWGVSTAGTNALYIDASQNVGIGTTSPGAILDVQSSAPVIRNTATTGTNQVAIRQGNTGGYFYTGIDTSTGGYLTGAAYAGFHWMSGAYPMIFATNNSERMRIDSSGNVGIGTTTNYQINSTSATPKQMIAMTGNTGLNILRYNGFGGAGAILNLGASGGASLGTYSGAVANSGLGSINFGGDNGTNYNGNGAQIIAAASETWTTGTNAGYLTFATTSSGSTSPTERMRIDSSGNLLVGTTSNLGLGGKFTVANASGAIGSFSCANGATAFGFGNQSGTGTYNAIYFYTNGFGTNVGSIAVNSASTSYNTTSDQRMKTNIQNSESALPVLETIKIRQFDWVTTNTHERYGVIAQELDTVAPEAVSQGLTENDMWAVDHSKLVPMLVKAIQELKAEFDAYKAEHP